MMEDVHNKHTIKLLLNGWFLSNSYNDIFAPEKSYSQLRSNALEVLKMNDSSKHLLVQIQWQKH